MAITATVQNAIKMFKYNPKATKWLPKTNLKNATVAFEKRTFNNGSYQIIKNVRRKDGQELRGIFNSDGSLYACHQKTNKGTIETIFGGEHYNKCTYIRTNNGEYIARLGHKGQPQRYVDAYQGRDGICREGKFPDIFNRMRLEVQNAKLPEWMQKILEQCKF